MIESKLDTLLNLPDRDFKLTVDRMNKGRPLKKVTGVPNSIQAIDKAISYLTTIEKGVDNV